MKIFEKAKDLSLALYPVDFSDLKRCCHWSFLFKKNQLLCAASNSQKTHSRNRFNLKDFDIGLKNSCAENGLFIKAKNKFTDLDWSKLTIVNTRINREGQFCMAAPCNSCQNLINWLSPRRVFFTNVNGDFERYL